MTINDVLTIPEAVELYSVKSISLRQRLERGKAFIHGVDCRKTGSGERGDWLVTREAMDRIYGTV